MNVMHSMRNDDWMTPLWLIEKARAVLKGIDLDPASSEYANTRVNAAKYFDIEKDGLNQSWFGTVFCNPPGGKLRNKSMTGLFWKKLMEEVNGGLIDHAIFLCFSLEAMQSTQGRAVRSVCEFPFCVPSKRIQFDFPGPVVKKAPSHSNVIVYVPGRINLTYRFAEEFASVGVVRL